MNKPTRIALICIMCVAAALASSSLTAAYLNRTQTSGVPIPVSRDFPVLGGATKNNDYYNISLAFANVTDNETLDNILINPQSSKTVTDATFYLNGTAVNQQDPVTCSLKSGDSLQISLTLSCSEFPSGSTIMLDVMGSCFGCGEALRLP